MSYRTPVRRNLALVVLLSLEALVVALSALFHTRARVSVLEAFRAYDTTIPGLTQLALSPWLVPAAIAVAALFDLAALALPLRRSQRTAFVAAGLFVSSSVLIFAVVAAFAPIFRPE